MQSFTHTKALFNSLYREIKVYSDREKKNITEYLIHYFFGLKPIDIAMDAPLPAESDKALYRIFTAIGEINQKKPIQYILGEADFMGLTFEVTPGVLIPRPETEELVELVLTQVKDTHVKVLDIGTGSGCIPISLKATQPNWSVWAMDVSTEAIGIAKTNAHKNEVEVNWIVDSILNPRELQTETFDVIVSNPPYITHEEKNLMDKNVIEHEPALALFVPDDDPLKFYRAIGEFAFSNLNENGKLFLELNEHFGKETQNLLQDKGFRNVLLHEDLQGKQRMISCEK